MNPSKAGDTHDIAKLSLMNWLDPDKKKWLIHPMYFPPSDPAFPCRYADALRVRLVSGDVRRRQRLVEAVAQDCGHLFLDPDTGLQLKNAKQWKYVSVHELIEIAKSPARKGYLTLVYDHSISRYYKKDGTPGQQIREKLRHLHKAGVHAAAYIAHNQRISFVWASTDANILSDATCRIVTASCLPDCCFVDDGCSHIPHPLG